MAHQSFFPDLPESWEATRATLHSYAHGVTALPRALAPAHPMWWHASLKVTPTGLATDSVPIPGGGALGIRMDIAHHRALIETSDGATRVFDLTGGATSTAFADELLAAAADLGVSGEVDREKFENEDARVYDPSAAIAFWTSLTNAATVLEAHRRTLDGPVSPLQVWPHGFDISFEWFGTKVEIHDEGGETTEHPAQLNFGFYPGAEPYFYANPWPFDESLAGQDLDGGAVWHTEGWQGTMLPYSAVQGAEDGPSELAAYYCQVFERAQPTLMR